MKYEQSGIIFFRSERFSDRDDLLILFVLIFELLLAGPLPWSDHEKCYDKFQACDIFMSFLKKYFSPRRNVQSYFDFVANLSCEIFLST